MQLSTYTPSVFLHNYPTTQGAMQRTVAGGACTVHARPPTLRPPATVNVRVTSNRDLPVRLRRRTNYGLRVASSSRD